MDQSPISIRLAEAKDLEAVHHLVRELALFEQAEHEFIATLETYQKDFRSGLFEVLVAEKKGKIIGMCLYYMTFSTWKGKMLYLEDFVVSETHRRTGVGQALFDVLQQRAIELECKLMKWQVLDWNEPAIRFYEKNKALIEREWWNGKLFFGK